MEGTNRLVVKGADKEAVGQTAADIRALRPPEPYKGKGIRYAGEYVRRKAGKAGKGGRGRRRYDNEGKDSRRGQTETTRARPQQGQGHSVAAATLRVPQPVAHLCPGNRRCRRPHARRRLRHREGAGSEPRRQEEDRRRRLPSASSSRRGRARRAWSRSSSTAAATASTVASRPSPKRPVRPDCASNKELSDGS